MEYDLSTIMNSAQTTVLILGVLVILFVIVKDIYSSKVQTEILQKDHQNIIDKLANTFSGITELHGALTGSTDQLASKMEKLQDSINLISRHLAVEAIKLESMEDNLTKVQMDSSRQTQAISFVSDQIKQLQSRNIELLRENSILQDEIENLKNHNRDLQRKLNRGRSNDPER
jgi:chromosome segregation ATPase